MKRAAGLAVLGMAVLGLGACEGMAPGGYGDMPDDPNIAAAQAAAQAAAARSAMPQPQMPMPPAPMSFPNGQPRPSAIPQPVIPPPPMTTGGPLRTSPPPAAPTTGGPLQTQKPPSAPAPPKPTGGPACSSPNVSIRTEAYGAVEIKCGAPPAPVPAGMSCKAGEQLTYLTRNGASSYQCMK